MGSLYRPSYRGTDGTKKESAIIWLKYRDALGVLRRESSGTEREQDARRLLRQREGAAVEGRVVLPRADKITVSELAERVRADYRANGRRSADRLEYSLAHILPFFGARRAIQVTTPTIDAYIKMRLEAKATASTINKELAALRRAYSLARKAELLYRHPHIPRLAENNIRKGFFERQAFEAIRACLPAQYRALVGAMYLTGWRVEELTSREWPHVDLKAGWLRLEPGETKNGEGRMFPLLTLPELSGIFQAQRQMTLEQERRTGRIIPFVFHHRDRRVGDFRKAWKTACLAAGYAVLVSAKPRKIGGYPLLHDFRRTAVRNLERAGVSRSAAMKMVGHRTEAIYRRYAVTSEADLRDAGAKLAAIHQQDQHGAEVIALGKVLGKVKGQPKSPPR
jgi:integrase